MSRWVLGSGEGSRWVIVVWVGLPGLALMADRGGTSPGDFPRADVCGVLQEDVVDGGAWLVGGDYEVAEFSVVTFAAEKLSAARIDHAAVAESFSAGSKNKRAWVKMTSEKFLDAGVWEFVNMDSFVL